MSKGISKYILFLILFGPQEYFGQTIEFDKSDWEHDKYGQFGDRSRMELPAVLNEEFLSGANDNGVDSLIEILGQPDKYCCSFRQISLYWYLEGFKDKQHFESKNFLGKSCGEKFPFGNSFIVFIFNSNGEFISTASIKEGG